MGAEQAIKFIKAVFGTTTEQPVHFCSLDNERDGPNAPRMVSTRDGEHLLRFMSKWDMQGRALYFCVGTLKPGAKRTKPSVVEIPALYADIDFKDIIDSPADIERKLLQLRCPPSIIIKSGHGFHVYWLFREAISFGSRSDGESTEGNEWDCLEATLRQLADTVGGDYSVCEIARLMRLPGSHNSKRGDWIEVEIISFVEDRRYELDDLEEWLSETSPITLRKERPSQTPDDNPWLKAAQLLGFKPSIDVEKRLAGMSYMGGGDSSIHQTQLAVSASLLTQGSDIEDVVATLLEATKAAAGQYGDRWNWRREEAGIREMCESWVKKHPKAAAQPPTSAPVSERKVTAASGAASVVSLAEARAAKAKKKPQKEGAPTHVVLGEAVLAAIRQRGDDLLFTPKAAWKYSNGLWAMEIDGLRSWLDVEAEIACRELNIDSANRVVSETRQWITRNPTLWHDNIAWDSHGKVPCRSGLIDPATLELTPAKPEHYCTWRIDCDYEPQALCPWWETMLIDFFGDREPEQRGKLAAVIQECLGAALLDTKPRALSKALIFQGGSNFGKSGILEVLGGLFGQDQIATGLEALEGSHGLMAFTKRLPWVLHEAFDQRKWHFSSVVKAIITGEPVNINIKNGPMLSVRIKAPIFWGTNHPPQFKEATKAIINRLIVIECRREFLEGKPVGAALEAFQRGLDKPSTLVLRDEMSGLLNWALAGLRRALERQYIEVTDEIRDTADEIRRDSNLVAGFLEECVEYAPDKRVSVPDFCAAFSVWWLENKGEDRRIPSNDAIGKALIAMADPKIATHSKELRDKNKRYYAGILLNEFGLTFHKRATEAKAFEGKIASTTTGDGLINTSIPDGWRDRPSIIAMRIGQTRSMTRAGDTWESVNSQVSPKSSVTHSSVTKTSVIDPVIDQVSPTQRTEESRKPRF